MPVDALFLLLAAGVAAGFVAGLFGVGGGVIVVPTLRFLAPALGWPPELAMHLAVATSVAAVLPTAISSARAHAKHGNVDWAIIRTWGPPMALGAVVAGALGGSLSTGGLTLVFATIAALVGLRMATGLSTRFRDALPSVGLQRLIAATVGWFSSWMGIGAGTLGVPSLTAFGVKMHRAVGTAAMLGIFVSFPSLLGWLWSGRNGASAAGPSLGYIQLLPWAAMLLPMVLLAPWGARVAKSLRAKNLTRIFGVFLLCVSVALFDRALG